MLLIACQKCGSAICTYQKDGPGNLRRMYIDRMSEPKISIGRKDLTCAKGHLVGVKIKGINPFFAVARSESQAKTLAFSRFARQ